MDDDTSPDEVTDEDVELAAEAIYEKFPYDGPGVKPDWVPRGNSHKQEEARDYARAALHAHARRPGPVDFQKPLEFEDGTPILTCVWDTGSGVSAWMVTTDKCPEPWSELCFSPNGEGTLVDSDGVVVGFPELPKVRNRPFRLPPIPEGQKRAFKKCDCGAVGFYDYQPFSLSNPIMIMPCGHDARSARNISQTEFLRAKGACR